MAWPAWIAAATGLITAVLILRDQHGTHTTPQDPPDGEPP